MKRVKMVFVCALALWLVAGCGGAGNAGYDPKADAVAQIDSAISEAKERGKHVVLQVGGSWCPWCVRLHKFLTDDMELRRRVTEDYVWVQIYYGKENKNEKALSRLGDLRGYGVPVLVVLSPVGEVVHIQNTGELEEGEGYSKARVLEFLDRYAEVPMPEVSSLENVDTLRREEVLR